MAESRPNILLVMTDEHTPGVMGSGGNPLARTPHIDALAASGIRFDGCYCNSPLCMPSRLSFTAGRYASRIGVWSNGCTKWKLPSMLAAIGQQTIFHLMNAAGYDTRVCGRVNYDNAGRFGAARIGPPEGDVLNLDRGDAVVGLAKDKRMAADFVADDHAARERVSRRRAVLARWWSGHLDDDQATTRAACQFLRQRDPGDRPVFLSVGYFSPHGPFIVPREYWEPYRNRVPAPVLPAGLLDRLPLNYRCQRENALVAAHTQQDIRDSIERYYALTQWVDDQIGQVLDAFAESGLAENTVVIYTSDHGDNLHEHGLMGKSSMYEGSCRVPLILSSPRRWAGGQQRGQACSLVDLSATLLELAGVDRPHWLDGDSLLPWADDPGAAWKDLAVSEYYAHGIASGISMVRSGRYKYVYHAAADAYTAPQRELFDLSDDPLEFTNLADAPQQRQRAAQMHALLVWQLGEDPEAIEQRYRSEWQAASQAAG